MTTITIRGIDLELLQEIKKSAAKEKKSVNKLLVEKIKLLFNPSSEATLKEYSDLDNLAGGWSIDDEKSFNKGTEFFREIDEEIWQ